MKIDILNLIDFEKVDTLLEGFNKTTGFVTAILDLKGTVLSKSGWRHMCTHFHRINPETSAKCTVSDTVLAGKMAEGEKYHFYKCLNGLVDVAVPIIINNEHVANLFSGQFFFEEPDREFFKKQAVKYNFDEQKYLESLEKVPVVSKEKVLLAMDFLLNMTQMISDMSFQKMKQIELNKTIMESEDRFTKVFKTSPIAISIASTTDGKLSDVNDTWCQLMGFSEKEALGHNVEELKIIDTETRKKIREEFISKGKIRLLESNISTKSGEKKSILTSVEAITLGDKQFSINLVTDITERKQVELKALALQVKLKEALEASNQSRKTLLSVLEDQQRSQQEIKLLNADLENRVKERTKQLELANKELEAFSYSVSHDLRAPLRGIDGFSLALVEDYEEKLDDTAKDYITRIRAATKKMDRLIDSLLKLSRISRFDMNIDVVNLSKIVVRITNELTALDQSRKTEFIIPENITTFGDASLLNIVFENLLNNAWKFTSKNVKTIIEFGAFKENSKTVYFVKDNGIGFDMQYVNKLFSAFQRLHSDKEYPGTGVGLTTVQRIIRRHNGEIWAESELNVGTTFYFTIEEIENLQI